MMDENEVGLDTDNEKVDQIDATHPASVEQCDHPNCTQESPGRQRLCDDCTQVMHPSNADTCEFCGASI